MIEDDAVQRFGGRGEPARGPAVSLARADIAAGMIVGKDDAGAAVADRIGDDFLQRECAAGMVAVMMAEMEATGLVVDMGNPQPLAARIGTPEARSEEGAGGLLAVELQGTFGTLIVHHLTLRVSSGRD